MKARAIVHEILSREHRIVLIQEDGTTDAGKWYPSHEVANHRQYFAVVGESVLPQGVFTTKEVDHQVLGT